MLDLNEILLQRPLYSKISIDAGMSEILCSYFFEGFSIDAYCPECEKESTFKHHPSMTNEHTVFFSNLKWAENDPSRRVDKSEKVVSKDQKAFFLRVLANRFHHIELDCSRSVSHKMHFTFFLSNTKMIKVGQFPSSDDISNHSILQYKSILPPEKFIEFSRAVRLNSHGIGIGAFVYLRRIFEHLVEESHDECRSRKDWDESKFNTSKMSEKLKMINSELSNYFSGAGELYAILSKGIHELSEDECIEFFEIVKQGIELILEEKIAAIKIEQKKKSIGSSLNRLNSNLSGKQ